VYSHVGREEKKRKEKKKKQKIQNEKLILKRDDLMLL
jgi:hypothetical protein